MTEKQRQGYSCIQVARSNQPITQELNDRTTEMTDNPNVLPFSRPNGEALQRVGWQVVTQIGQYCVACKDHEETVFLWQDDHWQAISMRRRKAS
jgi:hypothetical protein